MKLLNLYYRVKPLIPHTWRLALRRKIALRKRAQNTDVWPINKAAAKQPAWWPGWPNGRKFAFVLTHDVEGTKGMEQCMSLAKLEMDLGFRSAFNFVPEGQYELP